MAYLQTLLGRWVRIPERKKKNTREAHSSPGPAAAEELSLLTGWGLSWEKSQVTFKPDLSPLEVSHMGQS